MLQNDLERRYYGALYEEIKKIPQENTQQEKEEAMVRLQACIKGAISLDGGGGVSTSAEKLKDSEIAISDADAASKGVAIGESYAAGPGVLGVKEGTVLIRLATILMIVFCSIGLSAQNDFEGSGGNCFHTGDANLVPELNVTAPTVRDGCVISIDRVGKAIWGYSGGSWSIITGNPVVIEDILTSVSSTNGLSASQGKVLKDLLDQMELDKVDKPTNIADAGKSLVVNAAGDGVEYQDISGDTYRDSTGVLQDSIVISYRSTNDAAYVEINRDTVRFPATTTYRDSSAISQDSILIAYQNGLEINRDTVRFTDVDTDSIYYSLDGTTSLINRLDTIKVEGKDSIWTNLDTTFFRSWSGLELDTLIASEKHIANSNLTMEQTDTLYLDGKRLVIEDSDGDQTVFFDEGFNKSDGWVDNTTGGLQPAGGTVGINLYNGVNQHIGFANGEGPLRINLISNRSVTDRWWFSTTSIPTTSDTLVFGSTAQIYYPLQADGTQEQVDTIFLPNGETVTFAFENQTGKSTMVYSSMKIDQLSGSVLNKPVKITTTVVDPLETNTHYVVDLTANANVSLEQKEGVWNFHNPSQSNKDFALTIDNGVTATFTDVAGVQQTGAFTVDSEVPFWILNTDASENYYVSVPFVTAASSPFVVGGDWNLPANTPDLTVPANRVDSDGNPYIFRIVGSGTVDLGNGPVLYEDRGEIRNYSTTSFRYDPPNVVQNELTQLQVEDKSDITFGLVSGERLEQAVVKRAVQKGTTAEKIALGVVPSSTPFFDTDLGSLQYYKTSSDNFTVNKAATDLPYLVEWADANSVFSNMQFKITTSPTEITDNSVINLPNGQDVALYIIGRQFFNGSIAANTLGGSFTVRNDNGTLTLVSIDPNRYWGGGLDYTTAAYADIPNLVTSPVGITISDVNTILTNVTSAGIWTSIGSSTEGLRGEPVADNTALTALTARDYERRKVLADGKEYVFELGAVAGTLVDDGATGFWQEEILSGLRQPPIADLTALSAVVSSDGMHQTVLDDGTGTRVEYVFYDGRTPIGTDVADGGATGAWVKIETYGTVEDIGDVVFKLNEWTGNVGISNGILTTVNTAMDWSSAEKFEIVVTDADGSQDHKTYRGDVSTITSTTGNSLLIDRFDNEFMWINNLNLTTGVFQSQVAGSSGWRVTKVTLYGTKSVGTVIRPEDVPVDQTGIVEGDLYEADGSGGFRKSTKGRIYENTTDQTIPNALINTYATDIPALEDGDVITVIVARGTNVYDLTSRFIGSGFVYDHEVKDLEWTTEIVGSQLRLQAVAGGGTQAVKAIFIERH